MKKVPLSPLLFVFTVACLVAWPGHGANPEAAAEAAGVFAGVSLTVALQILGGFLAGGIVAYLAQRYLSPARPRPGDDEAAPDGNVLVTGLPWMKNLLAVGGGAIVLVLLVISAEGLFKIDLPEVAWGIIGGVITKLFDVVMEIVAMYKTILQAMLADMMEAGGAEDGDEDPSPDGPRLVG